MKKINTILYYLSFLLGGGVFGLLIVGGWHHIFNKQTFLNGKLVETLSREEIQQLVVSTPASLASVTTLDIFGVGIILNGDFTIAMFLLCTVLFLAFGYFFKKIIKKYAHN